jgi:hypothetical protein
MQRRFPALFIILCVALGVVLPARAQEEYTLRYRFEKGKSYRFIDTINVKSSQEVMGQEVKATSLVGVTTHVVATDISDDGSAVLILAPEAITYTIHSSRMDTTITPKELIGKRSRVSVSRLGLMSRRETIDTVTMTGMMRGMAQRETVRFHVFPEGPVKVGGTWTSVRPDTNEAMGSKVVTEETMEYTVLGKENRDGKEALKISYKGKLTVTGKGSMMGSDFFVEGSGTTGGTFYLDPVSGLTLADDSTLDMESTVAITGQQKMTIPSSQSVTTHHVLAAD